MGVSALDCAFIVRSLLLLWCFKEVSWRLNLPSFLPPKTSFLFTLLKEETEKKEALHDDDNDDDIIIKQSTVIKYVFVCSIYCAQK